jgi:hypothetical protein
VTGDKAVAQRDVGAAVDRNEPAVGMADVGLAGDDSFKMTRPFKALLK